MMPVLDCSVKNCVHNCDNRCCRSSILVEGEHATSERDTCCASFDYRSRCGCTNRELRPETKLVVECRAIDCAYNEDCKCHAGHIGIAGSEARLARDTECASFQMA